MREGVIKFLTLLLEAFKIDNISVFWRETKSFQRQFVKDFSAKYSVSCDPVINDRVACIFMCYRLDPSTPCLSQ